MFLLSQSAKIREAWQFFKRECVTLKAENGEIINSFTRLLNYIYKNMAQTINQRIDALRALLTYIIHSGFISGYQNRYGDNLKPPTNVYHRMTA